MPTTLSPLRANLSRGTMSLCFLIALVLTALWSPTAHARDTLDISPSPLVIEGVAAVKLTIKKGEAVLAGDAAKFSAEANEFVTFDPATLSVTPKKSGKTKLKIQYRESDTVQHTGEVDVVVKYKQVSL